MFAAQRALRSALTSARSRAPRVSGQRSSHAMFIVGRIMKSLACPLRWLQAPTTVVSRNMGGGHGPPPTYTGIEAQVRAVLKEDWQVSRSLLAGSEWRSGLVVRGHGPGLSAVAVVLFRLSNAVRTGREGGCCCC